MNILWTTNWSNPKYTYHREYALGYFPGAGNLSRLFPRSISSTFHADFLLFHLCSAKSFFIRPHFFFFIAITYNQWILIFYCPEIISWLLDIYIFQTGRISANYSCKALGRWQTYQIQARSQHSAINEKAEEERDQLNTRPHFITFKWNIRWHQVQ